jgi:hypothetical protein
VAGLESSPIPRLIHLIWLGSEPGPKLLGNIQRLQELNPEWEIRLWRDGELDWLQNRSLFESAATWAGRSNIARYEIILRHGGFYVDADFEFFRPIDVTGIPLEGLVVVPERLGLFCNAFFAAAPHHPCLARLVEHVGPSTDFHTRFGQPSQVSSGPHFFSDELLAWAEDSGGRWSELPRDLVYPYSFDKLALRSSAGNCVVVNLMLARWARVQWKRIRRAPASFSGVAEAAGVAGEVLLINNCLALGDKQLCQFRVGIGGVIVNVRAVLEEYRRNVRRTSRVRSRRRVQGNRIR